jgi:hypothetical protein
VRGSKLRVLGQKKVGKIRGIKATMTDLHKKMQQDVGNIESVLAEVQGFCDSLMNTEKIIKLFHVSNTKRVPTQCAAMHIAQHLVAWDTEWVTSKLEIRNHPFFFIAITLNF